MHKLKPSRPFQSEALYFQYMPDETAQAYLVGVQRSLIQEHMTGGRLVKPNKLHMTILHFGYLQETYQQLSLVQPNLSENTYYDTVQQLIYRSKPLLPKTLLAQPQGLERYGPHDNVLALTLQPSNQLSDIHATVVVEIQNFLKQCEIDPKTPLPHRPRALQVTPKFNPHISLIKGFQDMNSIMKIPPRTTDPLRLHLYR